MKTISQTRKTISYALKLTVILSAAAGTVMSAIAGRNSFMGGSIWFYERTAVYGMRMVAPDPDGVPDRCRVVLCGSCGTNREKIRLIRVFKRIIAVKH